MPVLRDIPHALLTVVPYVLFAAYLALIGLEATASTRRIPRPAPSLARTERAQPAGARSSGPAMQLRD
jgi:hypothetical protein